MALSPGTGELILRAAQGISQTLQFQKQMAQRQKEREETHRIQLENQKAKAEADALKARLDTQRIQLQAADIKTKQARATREQAEARLVEEHGVLGAERLMAAARALPRGGEGGLSQLKDRVNRAAQGGNLRLLQNDLGSQDPTSAEIRSAAGIEIDPETGRAFFRFKVNDKSATADYQQTFKQLGVGNPGDVSEIRTVRDSIDRQISSLRIAMTTHQREGPQASADLKELVKRREAAQVAMAWAHESAKRRTQTDVFRASGDAELLGIIQTVDDAGANRQVAMSEMPSTMSVDAKEAFFLQATNRETPAKTIANALLKNYPKTELGAFNNNSPEAKSLLKLLEGIHDEKKLSDIRAIIIANEK